MQLDLKFETGNNKEYEVDEIKTSAVYTKKSIISQLPELYYLFLKKGYPEKKNT